MSDIIHIEPDVDGFGVGKEDGLIIIDFTDGEDAPAYPVKIFLSPDSAEVLIDFLKMALAFPYDDFREWPTP